MKSWQVITLTVALVIILTYMFLTGMFSDRFTINLTQSLPGAGKSEVEILKDRPEVRFKKWNGEVNMGVSYEQVQGKAEKTPDEKIVWKDPENTKEEVHAYPIDPSVSQKAGIGSGGGFEIEVVLNEKPSTNKFDFKIDGVENLDFFYQPDIRDRGFKQADNVIGSYAVYHKEHKNHIQGQTNYGTGKVYHIYRPKAIDASGAEQWAELHYDGNGVLSVTVPQEFLDKAVYPVIVDPTFGDTSCGATSSSGAGTATNYLEMIANSPAGTNTLTNISICFEPGLSYNTVQFGFYTDNGSDDPDTRLVYDTVEWAFNSTDIQYYTNPVAWSYSLAPNTKYWAGEYHNNNAEFRYDVVTGYDIWYGDTAGLPASAGGTKEPDIQSSVYATYSSAVTDSSNAHVNVRGGGSATNSNVKIRGGGTSGNVKFR